MDESRIAIAAASASRSGAEPILTTALEPATGFALPGAITAISNPSLKDVAPSFKAPTKREPQEALLGAAASDAAT